MTFIALRCFEASERCLMCAEPAGRDRAVITVMRGEVMHLAGHLCAACKERVDQENEAMDDEYERLCRVAERQAQEFLQDCFVAQYGGGNLVLACQVEDVDWARAVMVTVIGPDGARRVEYRPRG